MTEEKEVYNGTEEVNPQEDGIPGLDELASRLQLPAVENPDNHNDLLMLSKTGKFYSMTLLMAFMVEFMSQVVVHMSGMMYQMNEKLQPEDKKDAKQTKRTS